MISFIYWHIFSVLHYISSANFKIHLVIENNIIISLIRSILREGFGNTIKIISIYVLIKYFLLFSNPPFIQLVCLTIKLMMIKIWINKQRKITKILEEYTRII